MVLHFVLVVLVESLSVTVVEFEVRSWTREEWVEDFHSAVGEHLQDLQHPVKRGCRCPLSLASDLQVRGRCSRSRSRVTYFSLLRWSRIEPHARPMFKMTS